MMTPTQTTTALFMVAMGAIVAAYDVWAYRSGVPVTISGVLHNLAQQWPLFAYLVAFALGFLICHLFGLMTKGK
jgi:hypothetical protein